MVRVAEVRVADGLLELTTTTRQVLRVPLSWYPRLRAATAADRAAWQLDADGTGVSWGAVGERIQLVDVARQAALLAPPKSW